MIGIVTGLAAEARIARRLGPARAGGGGPDGARHAAETLVGEGVRALVSFGLAGGLSPELGAGAVIVPRVVLSGGATFITDPGLRSWLGGNSGHVLLAGHAIAATVAEKAALREEFGADAIDLESGAVGAVAARHGLRFAALRAVCDPADADLPEAALAGLNDRGAIALWRVLRSVWGKPEQIGPLLRLSGQARSARAALIRRVSAASRKAPP